MILNRLVWPPSAWFSKYKTCCSTAQPSLQRLPLWSHKPRREVPSPWHCTAEARWGTKNMMHPCSLSRACHFFLTSMSEFSVPILSSSNGSSCKRRGALWEYVVSARTVCFYKEGCNWSDPPLENQSGRPRAVAFILMLLVKVSLVPEKTTCLLFLLQFYSELAICSSVWSL